MDPYVVGAVRRFVDETEANLKDGRGIWFYGSLGTGKTTLAMLVSSNALNLGHSVAIYSLPRLLGILRQTFEDSTEDSLVDLLDRLTEVELLHIDDVGAEQSSPWVLEQLYAIVNSRYEANRSIMITTNLDLDMLREQIGERTVSRLVEMCGDPLPLFGSDSRMDAGIELPTSHNAE
jgi:DNA replication protein DnaC